MHVVVTGGDGFIARNLRVRLSERGGTTVSSLTRRSSPDDVRAALGSADIVFHLAGANRPADPSDFETTNTGYTAMICEALASAGRAVPLVFTSSTQAELDNPYGRSKRGGEDAVRSYGTATGAATTVLRLPNVFGKWARPNYNSAVATFCHNVANGLPITVNDPAAALSLVHVDDVTDGMLRALDGGDAAVPDERIHRTTVGQVASTITSFATGRTTLEVDRVGNGLTRALYATYVTYLPTDQFAYTVPRHADPRGVFVEMIKTKDSGQLSYFTAGPGITRGEHYHHAKTEKFLVIRGTARFGFRHILSGERLNVDVTGTEARIVETVPGWAHNVSNIGTDELIVMLWANEVFDPKRPDTIASPVGS